MSAPGITEAVLREIAGEAFDVIVMNFANPDMVGHSGRLRPTIQAIGAVDSCLGRLWKALEPKRAAWMITADHGKAEVMVDTDTGTPRTYQSGHKYADRSELQDRILSVRGQEEHADGPGGLLEAA